MKLNQDIMTGVEIAIIEAGYGIDLYNTNQDETQESWNKAYEEGVPAALEIFKQEETSWWAGAVRDEAASEDLLSEVDPVDVVRFTKFLLGMTKAEVTLKRGSFSKTFHDVKSFMGVANLFIMAYAEAGELRTKTEEFNDFEIEINFI